MPICHNNTSKYPYTHNINSSFTQRQMVCGTPHPCNRLPMVQYCWWAAEDTTHMRPRPAFRQALRPNPNRISILSNLSLLKAGSAMLGAWGDSINPWYISHNRQCHSHSKLCHNNKLYHPSNSR